MGCFILICCFKLLFLESILWFYSVQYQLSSKTVNCINSAQKNYQLIKNPRQWMEYALDEIRIGWNTHWMEYPWQRELSAKVSVRLITINFDLIILHTKRICISIKSIVAFNCFRLIAFAKSALYAFLEPSS